MKWQPIETAPKTSRFIGGRNLDKPHAEVWLIAPAVRDVRGRKIVEFYAGRQRVFPQAWVPMPDGFNAA